MTRSGNAAMAKGHNFNGLKTHKFSSAP